MRRHAKAKMLGSRAAARMTAAHGDLTGLNAPADTHVDPTTDRVDIRSGLSGLEQ